MSTQHPDSPTYCFIDDRSEEVHDRGFFTLRKLGVGDTFEDPRTRTTWFIKEVAPVDEEGIVWLRAVPTGHLPD